MTATRPKDLWSSEPVWFSYDCPLVFSSHLERNEHADVVVVGSGVSGAAVAQCLAEDGYSVIILDKRAPGYGSTSASTALLQYDLDQPLIKLSKKLGKEKAEQSWLRSKQGFDRLARKTQELGIDCGFEWKESLYLAGNALNEEEMKREAEERNAIGLQTEYVTRERLHHEFGISKPAALLIKESLSVDPRRFVAGYLTSALEKKARIFSPVEVTDVESKNNSVTLHTDQGHKVTASFVVFATGYEIFKKISLRKKQIASTWAIATKQQPDKLWPSEAHIWEASTPYLYMRTTPDGRIVCGGEDEDFSDEERRDSLLPAKTRTLENKLQKLFPQIDPTAEFSWAGCFGETDTSLPMIGPVPGIKNCYAILAFGGNGITFSHIACELITKYIKGEKDPDAELFAIV